MSASVDELNTATYHACAEIPVDRRRVLDRWLVSCLDVMTESLVGRHVDLYRLFHRQLINRSDMCAGPRLRSGVWMTSCVSTPGPVGGAMS